MLLHQASDGKGSTWNPGAGPLGVGDLVTCLKAWPAARNPALRYRDGRGRDSYRTRQQQGASVAPDGDLLHGQEFHWGNLLLKEIGASLESLLQPRFHPRCDELFPKAGKAFILQSETKPELHQC